jgi:hypothetical protein
VAFWHRFKLSPFAPSAFRTALAAIGVLSIVALVAGAVRLLPWAFDPAVPWRVAAPFARGLASIALEAAVLVGWPMGWALAAVRFVESGEARALEALGRRPARTVAGLAPQATLFAAVLAMVALAWGRDANEPGRVATELIAQSRVSCAHATAPITYAIPFTDLTWVCAPQAAPRLVGNAPAGLVGTLFTATDARIAGDFRAIDLSDARVSLPTSPPTNVHVGEVTLRGLAPWSRASTLAPALRALLDAVSAAAAATIAAVAALRGVAAGRIAALVLGASGPLAALGAMRALERLDARMPSYALVPLAAALATLLVSLVLWRLPLLIRAASTRKRPWETSASQRS